MNISRIALKNRCNIELDQFGLQFLAIDWIIAQAANN